MKMGDYCAERIWIKAVEYACQQFFEKDKKWLVGWVKNFKVMLTISNNLDCQPSFQLLWFASKTFEAQLKLSILWLSDITSTNKLALDL